MVATLARPSTTHAHQDEIRTLRFAPTPETADTAPTIDRAEALLLELAGMLPHLSERDRGNAAQVLDELGLAANRRADLLADAIADALAYVGPGKRVMDVIDQDEAAEKRAAVTHAAVVERYARAWHGVSDYGDAIRAELVAAYGDNLGDAIAGAAFHLYLHERHHDGAAAACGDCWA